MRHRIKGGVEARLSRGAVRREECGASPSCWLASQAWYLKLDCSIGAEHQYAVGNQ
jgi:hypothetical protein